MRDRLEHASCGFVEFEDDGTIVYANATITGWLGAAPGELRGRKFESLLTIANKVFFQTHFFPLLSLHGGAEEIFLALLTANGERIPVVASARREQTPEGPRNQCVFLTVHQRRKYEDEILQAKEAAETALRNNDELRVTKHDLELRARELERKLREVETHNADLQRVTQILSHDLREPIRKIGLFADLVREHLPAASESEAAVGLQKIDLELAQMGNLIDAMRQFLQPDATSPFEQLEVKALVEKATAAVAMQLKFNDWIVECEALPAVEGRRTQLHQLFVHLLENAVTFRDRSRRLRIKVRGQVIQKNAFEVTKNRYHYIDFARIEVQDNGCGFDPKYRDYVFQLLKKVHFDTPGLGVGLAISRKIAGLHYGTLEVDSKPGVGTTFILTLPVVH